MLTREEKITDWKIDFSDSVDDSLIELFALYNDCNINEKLIAEMKAKVEELHKTLEKAEKEYAILTMTKEDYLCKIGEI